MDKDQSPEVIVHEFGHAVEESFRTGPFDKVVDRSVQFLKYRVGDEKPTSMRDKFGTTFTADEMGRKDKFDQTFSEVRAYYVGKDYGNQATEILSMGLQEFYSDPVRFAKTDPEFTKYVMGILDGSLR
jgi:hypothetical protein